MKIDLWSPNKYSKEQIENYNNPIKLTRQCKNKWSKANKKRAKDIAKKKERRQAKLTAIQQRRKEYLAYMKSEAWTKKRGEFFDFLRKSKLKKQCDICGSKKMLHVHHLTYANFKNEDMHDLQLLCKICHMRQHPCKTF